MARIGWVSATEVGTDDWYRLAVFDDGWVDLPGFGRSLSDARSNLRRSLVNLAVVVGGLVALWGLSTVAGSLDGTPATVLRIVAVLLLVVAIGYAVVQTSRMRFRDRRQNRGDYEQARRARAAGRRVRRTEGAPMWRRADSAEQLAGWLTGVRLSRALDVETVRLSEISVDQQARVEFRDGTVREYRTPDAKISTLLGRFGVTASR